MTRSEASPRVQSTGDDMPDSEHLHASNPAETQRSAETQRTAETIATSNATKTDPRPARAKWWRWSLVIGYFVFANLWLINAAWFLNPDQIAAALGIPFSQCSLVAIWAVASNQNLVARFALTILNTLACWYTMTQIFYWGIGDPTSAAWAITLCTQVLMIAFSVHVFLVTRHGLDRVKAEATFRFQSYFSFDLRTLMLWTTTFAVGFGFIQWGRIQFGWSGSISRWPHVQGMPLIGIFNAAIALLMGWIAQATRWKRRASRFGIAAIVTALMCFTLPNAITLATEIQGLDYSEVIWLAISQCVHLLAALLLVSNVNKLPSRQQTERSAMPAGSP